MNQSLALLMVVLLLILKYHYIIPERRIISYQMLRKNCKNISYEFLKHKATFKCVCGDDFEKSISL